MVFLKTSLLFSCEFRAVFENQATKFGQLIECEKCFFFSENDAENEAGRLVSNLFLPYKETLEKIKANG